MDEALKFTKEVEQFMIEHGFDPDEALQCLKHWYDNPNNIVCNQSKAYWYYNFIINECDEEHLDNRFHSAIGHNENWINKCIKYNSNVGCITCNRIFDPKEIITYLSIPWEDSVRTAVCPYCQSNTVVPNYIYGRKRHYDNFEDLIGHAHDFWIVWGKYTLLPGGPLYY